MSAGEIPPGAVSTSRSSGVHNLPPRYAPRGILGQGGMGVVYRVFDRERGCEVALKVLTKLSAAQLAQFKRGYRALAELSHPNLASPYELVVTRDLAFVTMELVCGLDFVRYACLDGGPGAEQIARASIPSDLEPTAEACDSPSGAAPRDTARCNGRAHDYPRLRRLLGQLANGLNALHAAQRIHCDIKPANVIVCAQERLVVIDFGLARVTKPVFPAESTRAQGGTLSYLAPELRSGASPTPASDWYAAGVMLYRALAGSHPPAREFRPAFFPAEVPQDLREVCVGLLSDRPAWRLRAAASLGDLEAGERKEVTSVPPIFLGREAELERLRLAAEASAAGRGTITRVHGRSGVGKTALLEEFSRRLRERGFLVLHGRCHEGESLPFNAFDDVIEALARCLGREATPRLQALVRGLSSLLTTVFPALSPAFARAGTAPEPGPIADVREKRQAAFESLRALFRRLTAQRPVAICIDDAQWEDADSARLRAALFAGSDPPPLLLLLAYRPTLGVPPADPAAPSVTGEGLHHVEIPVGPLRAEEALALARALADRVGALLTDSLASVVAEEAGGIPFFIQQLVLDAQEGTSPISLEGLLQRRLESLSSDALRLLEPLAAAGQPLAQGVAEAAAGIARPFPAWASLRGGHWVTTEGWRVGDVAVIQHDRIRRAVLGRLDDGRREQAHARLAHVLAERGDAEPELLATLFTRAREPDRAAPHAAVAAARAADKLAFDEAARLYSVALEAGNLTASERCRLLRAHAESLSLSGRGAEAARAYLEAAAIASPAEAIVLEGLSAREALSAGLEDDGLGHLASVLSSLGLRLPTSRAAALAWLVRDRLLLWLRGRRFEERPSSEVSERELLRIDLLHAAAHSALGFQLSPMGAALGTRALALALRAGEPKRCARALLAESALISQAGRRKEERARALFRRARSLAQRHEDDYLEGFAALSLAHLNAHNGRLSSALASFDEAGRIFRARCRGAQWEITLSTMGQLAALHYLGDYREISRRLPEVSRRAEEMGRVNELALHALLAGELELVDDHPAAARALAVDGASRFHRHVTAVNLLDLLLLHFQVEIDLYEDCAARAWSRLQKELPGIARTGVLWLVQLFRVETLFWRAASALEAAASRKTGGADLRRAAARDARALAHEEVDYATVRSLLIRAGLASQDHTPELAAELFDKASTLATGLGLAVHAAAARRRQGEIVGGTEGGRLIASADATLASKGVANPIRLAGCFAPGVRPGH